MYKRLFLFVVVSVFANNVSAQHMNVDRRAEVAINGSWSMTAISYPDSESSPISAFGLADSKCFEGSHWKFVSSDDKGEMSLTNSNCQTWSSPIEWEINKEQQLLLKISNALKINQNAPTDYILKLANQTQSSFQLIEKVNQDGKMIDVVYSFRKLQ